MKNVIYNKFQLKLSTDYSGYLNDSDSPTVTIKTNIFNLLSSLIIIFLFSLFNMKKKI